MVFYFKTLNSGSIPAGGTVTKDWTADKDYTIKKVLVVNKGTATIDKVDLTIQFADNFKTLDYVNAYPLAVDLEHAWEPNEPLPRGSRVVVSFKNNDGTNAAQVDFVLLLEAQY